MNYQSVITEIQQSCERILRDNLVGVYLHGSIALGCFNWHRSDIDFIVVVKRALSRPEKRLLMDAMVALNAKAPPKGLEMSVVLKKHCRHFIYPTPFDLHFSDGHRDSYIANPDGYIDRLQGVDPDLAAHFTILRHCGLVLCGAPVASVFGEVPAEAYLDSIRRDVENAARDVLKNPLYIVLNLCRVAAYIREGLVLSKLQGGIWGLENLNGGEQKVIARALRCYRTEEIMRISPEEAALFCSTVLPVIFES
jgi:streptomycin 3"-adenylyltransferase